jgi:hypothetical protein
VNLDDMVITVDDIAEIKKLEENLAKAFEMENLGGLKYFLEI